MALDPKDVTVYENNHPDLREVGFKIVEVCLDTHILGQHYVRYQNEGEFIKCPRGENCSGWGCSETQTAFENLSIKQDR